MSEASNVIFVGPMNLPIPSELGAVENIIWNIALRLKTFGYRVSIFNPITTEKYKKFLFGLKLISYSGSIIHFHDFYSIRTYAMIRNTRSKCFLTLHYPPWRTLSPKGFKMTMTYLKYLHMLGVKIVVPSYIIKSFLMANRINSLYIPNGVDVQLFSPAKRSKELRDKLLDGKEYLILNVGRIHPDKNQGDLLKVAKKLREYRKDFKIVLVGPIGYFHRAAYDYYFTHLRNYVERHDLKEYVTFLGGVPRREVAILMASADIYVHPAIVEVAAPLVILEAMASGLPLIAYDLPYYRGYLVDGLNSLLVRPRDTDYLARTVDKLLNDDALRSTLGLVARKVAERFFSWDVIVKYYVRAYE